MGAAFCVDRVFQNMAHLRKIQKDAPDALEISVAQALADLEMNISEIRSDLAPLNIMSAREIDVTTNKKAIVIIVPFVQLAQFRKIQTKLVRELEKKFSEEAPKEQHGQASEEAVQPHCHRRAHCHLGG